LSRRALSRHNRSLPRKFDASGFNLTFHRVFSIPRARARARTDSALSLIPNSTEISQLAHHSIRNGLDSGDGGVEGLIGDHRSTTAARVWPWAGVGSLGLYQDCSLSVRVEGELNQPARFVSPDDSDRGQPGLSRTLHITHRVE
jgi:hypothetical protein